MLAAHFPAQRLNSSSRVKKDIFLTNGQTSRCTIDFDENQLAKLMELMGKRIKRATVRIAMEAAAGRRQLWSGQKPGRKADRKGDPAE
jgi:Arc/MetJ family transcription regulator